MAAFDEIGATKPLQEIAREWRLAHGSQVDLDDESELTFEVGLHRILACFYDLRIVMGEDDSTHPFSSDENISTKVEALGDAIRAVASAKSTLDRLLAVRDENAAAVLEALQKYLDLIPQAHPRRTGALHLIVKLAHRSEQLPRSLYVEDVALSHGRYDCGGFADVYEGMLENRAVAIKKPRMYGEDAFAHKRLSREALVWRQLRHPNVLLFIGLNSQLFPESTLPALISSWMLHSTLKNYMESPQSRTLRNILRLMCEIAEGLSYLHSLAIIHGDVNHVNILIDDQYRPQLADFGLVRLADTSTLRFTDTGNSYTLRWASPQRLDDNVRATSDDVYSYACVSYYMHSGVEPLHDVTSRYQMMHRVIQGERPSRPVGISPSVIEPSDSMDAVCKTMRIETAAKDNHAAVLARREASTGTQASTNTAASTSTMVSTSYNASPYTQLEVPKDVSLLKGDVAAGKSSRPNFSHARRATMESGGSTPLPSIYKRVRSAFASQQHLTVSSPTSAPSTQVSFNMEGNTQAHQTRRARAGSDLSGFTEATPASGRGSDEYGPDPMDGGGTAARRDRARNALRQQSQRLRSISGSLFSRPLPDDVGSEPVLEDDVDVPQLDKDLFERLARGDIAAQRFTRPVTSTKNSYVSDTAASHVSAFPTDAGSEEEDAIILAHLGRGDIVGQRFVPHDATRDNSSISDAASPSASEFTDIPTFEEDDPERAMRRARRHERRVPKLAALVAAAREGEGEAASA